MQGIHPRFPPELPFAHDKSQPPPSPPCPHVPWCQASEVETIQLLQGRKVRLREVRRLSQGHAGNDVGIGTQVFLG